MHQLLTLWFFSSSAGLAFNPKNILRILKKVVDWKSLGTELGIDLSKINEIKDNNREQVSECKRALIQFWLDSDTNCSWMMLADALESSDMIVLADKIRTEYCCPQGINGYLCDMYDQSECMWPMHDFIDCPVQTIGLHGNTYHV